MQRWLEAAFFGNKGMPYSPEGLMVAVDWGSLRVAALHASVAFKAAHILDTRADDSGEVVNVRTPLATPRSRVACISTRWRMPVDTGLFYD